MEKNEKHRKECIRPVGQLQKLKYTFNWNIRRRKESKQLK